MRLINVNAGYFRSYVQNIFENDCWENRYQGLDNLYGLFSKMDAEFQTEWLKLLCHLGPAFSYLVQSLWDKEEYVRSKAFAIMRAFTTLHLRSAFRCWEAYFLTANEEQRVPLLRQMIQLNALFPDWQVLQWESLLEALEPGLYMDLIDKHAQPPVTYDLLNDDDETLQTVESQNIKLLMITLAMQMLSNHLSISQNQVYRLKFILIQQMGFQNCHYFNDGGDIIIDFGPLRYNSESIAQIASMTSCVRGLKKVMDSFAPLPAETVAVMASQSVEHSKLHLSENTSPGVYFIDVVFKMINSGIDLTQLGHMVLKGWLETFLIVIYKHNILDSECERDIVNSMKVIIGLLTTNISEENKLLILEILKCLLRRSDHLTAMVLSKQIMALGKLLTKHGLRHSDPVLLKAKQFLKSAFLRFAVAGLFVLLFKNQSTSDSNNKEMDLFFVLRTVIDPEDTIPDEDIYGEPVYLYDQPVRDVLDKLMKQQMDRKAFSNVLSNTSRYVETVHSHPYSLSVLNELPSFLNALTKHTADWRRSDWDINPVLIMSARLLKEHPYQYSSLISPIQTVFKHGLQHCVVQPKTAAKLLASYSSVALIPGVSSENPFADVILEETKNCLSSVNRPSKETMQMLLQVIFWDLKPNGQKWYMEIEKTTTDETRERTRYFQNKIETLLPHLVNFLKLSSTSQQFTKKDFKIYNIASHLVAYQCSKDASQLEETPECLRFLNWFGLVLLSENLNVLLLKMLDYESIIVDLLVQTLYNVKIDFHTPDISFSYNRSNEVLLLCFVLLRTWALLKIRCRSIGDLQDMNQTSFWFTVWPALRRLLEMVELSTLLSSSGGFTRKDNLCHHFKLDEIGNSIFMQEEQEAERVVFIANFKRRITKTKSMFDTPPFEVPENTLINQLLLELRDVMRLEAESVIMQGNSRILTQNGASI
ncbi:hypothetical protein RO3G_15940 [Rhizopus delemar RA 99-880]|uniref:Uncharacterized protein n=1 Tax=Rhizopus delemar (strain RA 99-880 / ATCC MYA-4621 / FGSC 9543 / NRRL 43880) TaxID=246409 RepID=I1CRZ9_RHIO9|nr:hypothetical protein RO3G_15940 [Rhizopus delemar RA 99-880]|eukprot:EIE91229.1 hypothetical protein RO3G_15940 [Rhizopus delemar RA 99-880]